MQPEHTIKQRVVVTGATGLIGKRLSAALLDAGYHVTGFSRQGGRTEDEPGYTSASWQTDDLYGWGHELDGIYAVINLAGEPIASGRWTHHKMENILQSRLQSIDMLSDAIKKAKSPPTRFIQASAIGYYGTATAMNTTENGLKGTGFLADVCQQLENHTLQVPVSFTTRLRIGIVLDSKEGALRKMTEPMRFGLCGYPGNGRQYVSWIHIDDLISAVLHILGSDQPQRVYNLTAPAPVTIKEMLKVAATYKRAPFCLPIPPFMLALAFGEKMAKETVLASQHVLPGSLLSEGFTFAHPDCSSAIEEMFTV